MLTKCPNILHISFDKTDKTFRIAVFTTIFLVEQYASESFGVVLH